MHETLPVHSYAGQNEHKNRCDRYSANLNIICKDLRRKCNISSSYHNTQKIVLGESLTYGGQRQGSLPFQEKF
jgi:hypothetical protein